MSFFKRRGGALLVAVVVIVLSSFFAANRSLNVRVREVSDLFSTDFYDKNVGYPQKSIKSQLEVRKDASMNLISVGARYSEAEKETEKLREARTALDNGLKKSAGAKKLYEYNKELQTAYDALYAKLSAISLDANGKTIADESRVRMNGAASVIERNGYNEAVREFERTVLSVFPTNYIRQFAMVNGPELFE